MIFFQNIVEKAVYKVNDENSDQTVAVKSAWIESKMYGLSRAIEAFGFDRFRKNSQKAVNGFNFVLNNLFPKSGLTMQVQDSTGANLTVNGKEKLMDAAKKATHLAKFKAETIYATASFQPSQSWVEFFTTQNGIINYYSRQTYGLLDCFLKFEEIYLEVRVVDHGLLSIP